MLILGLNKTTLLDYPEHVAATIFTGGCNFRCPFCHNRDLVFAKESIESHLITPYREEEVLAFLKKRQNILTGVCITGGEPTLQQDLPAFIYRIKELGYLVKLDTNGYRPDVLRFLVNRQLVDYVAMDIKNSPEKYAVTTGLSTCQLSLIQESVSFLMSQNGLLPFEFRTTLVRELHDENDMRVISSKIKGASAYYLQSFRESPSTIAQGFHAHTADTLQNFLAICREEVPNTQLRGVD